MQNSRCLGLIGGLGVGATVHYYEKLANGCEKLGVQLDIVITNARTSRIFEYVEAGDRNGLADYLNSYIRRMKVAGAEIAAIPAIFEPLLCELAARAVRRVSIFGTRYVIAAELEAMDKQLSPPRPDCLRTAGEVGGLADRMAATVHLHAD